MSGAGCPTDAQVPERGRTDTASDRGALARGQLTCGGDIWTFVEALALHWILGATDAHAKNYSLLHAGRGSIRLAPLYDVASALPYPHLAQRKLKLAMSIGGEYGMHAIRARHIVKLATELRLDEQETLARFRDLAANVAREAEPLARQLRDEGLDTPLVATLATAVAERAIQISPS